MGAQTASEHYTDVMTRLVASMLARLGDIEDPALEAACATLNRFLPDKHPSHPASLASALRHGDTFMLDQEFDYLAALARPGEEKQWRELIPLAVLGAGYDVLSTQAMPGLHWTQDVFAYGIYVGGRVGLHVDDVSNLFSSTYPQIAGHVGAAILEPAGRPDPDGACRVEGLLPDWAVDEWGALKPPGSAFAAALDTIGATGRSLASGGFEITLPDEGIPVQVVANSLGLRWCRLDNIVYNDGSADSPPTMRLVQERRPAVEITIRVHRSTAQMCAALARGARSWAYLQDPGLLEQEAVEAWEGRSHGAPAQATAAQARAIVAGLPLPDPQPRMRPRLFQT